MPTKGGAYLHMVYTHILDTYTHTYVHTFVHTLTLMYTHAHKHTTHARILACTHEHTHTALYSVLRARKLYEICRGWQVNTIYFRLGCNNPVKQALEMDCLGVENWPGC